MQGLGAGVVAVDKGPLRPLRPNAILGALEESIARRNREGRMWSAFLGFFGFGDGSTIRRQALTKDEARRIAANVAKLPEPVAWFAAAAVRSLFSLSLSLAQRSTSRRALQPADRIVRSYFNIRYWSACSL